MQTVQKTAVQERDRGLRVMAGERVMYFDRTGRWLWVTAPTYAIRRGLDDRALLVDTTDAHGLAGRRYRDLRPEEKSGTVREIYEQALAAVAISPEPVRQRWLPKLSAWTPAKLAEDNAAFRQVYLPVSILPPEQYKAVVVQVTEGCSYNRCLFCDFYRDRPFHIKTDQELASHLARIRQFFGPRLKDRTGIFLGDGNAIIAPSARLLRALGQIRQELADVPPDIATFMDTFHAGMKPVSELNALRQAGLAAVYIGLETGDDELRALLKKPGKAEEAIGVIRRCKEAGLKVGVILLVGAGGRRFADSHLEHTAEVLRAVPFAPEDVVYLSPFVEPDLPAYREQMRAAGIEPMPPHELAQELARWQKALWFVHPARVTLYSIMEHIY
ncbi:radical SAM protein [Alicyclobacillus cellulosilyticus]|uniref:Radical SAM protein n=1 Tax=Alicyclobacillus cellulosilyticus TaxID=1003997 RepID=A0A917K3R9_9BACL|nr:radical SAM protein [Alicyclobacillus cellulosilyticus]GGI99960.1 radical SAM protein [Alicyclobacillus cellulosilyticus]